jgi:ATP-binding protein involved in chromosome partitioning
MVEATAPEPAPGEPQILSSEETVSEPNTFKVAIPLAEGRLCNHFGHCQQFAVIRVKEGVIDGEELHTPPPHEPGLLPRWLGDLGVNIILAGGMGQRALSLFAERGIRVLTGSPIQNPEALVTSYLAGNLSSGANLCDH